ncbi:polysaccharide deacetylase [Desulfuromonas versatilis]|uniref:Polysaccharide deacetylase n=1 Tax=Desulfuromonas versatilis TaxID=2802975 RepID=A0ABN6DZV6_9BACT|nr:polysaccharide deacetylase family protein [Desulfuromonas versatilis]BCR04744.1 polysaccharide deacetylase [Desulfuromonas versatilis]
MFKSSLWLSLLFLLTIPPSPARAGDVSVFVYHRFGESSLPSTNIDLETFSGQLEALRRGGFTVLPLGEVVRRLEGKDPLPERCAVLTVDDGYASFLTGAMPLLRRYGYPATLFVATDFVGHSGYLDWDQLRQLRAEGVEIGNHSSTHDHLVNRLPGEGEAEWHRRVRVDLETAQAELERHLGVRPELLAYPFGEYSPELIAVARELGFRGAAGQQSGVVSERAELFALPRFPMGGVYATLEGFQEKLAMRALPLRVVAPASPVIGRDNPPDLVVQIEAGAVRLEALRCFVPGQPNAEILPDPHIPGRVTIRAGQPLAGRRSKYTLTAPARQGPQWFWFSQLWINPAEPEP